MQAVRPIVDEVDPAAAYRLLETDSATALIDVRTRAEWAFVGVPDLSGTSRPLWLVEWARFPAMNQNPAFLEELGTQMGESVPRRLLFLCRSGARSMAAAQAVAASLAERGIEVHCSNVAEGFEGDLDAEGHRGRKNGWKARGLPWRQS
jgi:rhodanese-related sulfurtransferase